MLSPFVDTLNAVPRVTLLPLIVIWFGIGIWSKVMVVFLGAVIPILINTQAGVKTSEARFIRVARSFSASDIKYSLQHHPAGHRAVHLHWLEIRRRRQGPARSRPVGELYASTAGLAT